MNKRLRIGVAGLGIAFVLAIVLGVTGVLAPKSQRIALGASTTLTIISGQILVRHGTGDFAPAEDGAVLTVGDTVRTGADARAVLTYFEGSTVEMEPNSEVSIETAHGNPDGSTVIVMKQEIGSTWHVVTHLVQGASKYEVKTTSSTASVRGTAFQVGVAADLATTVTTTEGNVATSDPGSTKTVEVTQGQQTTTKKGEQPAAPKPAPEPERKVTVTVTDPNALVVDSLGRANGIKDGKVIVQTPGAQVKVVGGQLVVTLPDVPDGTIATHFTKTSAVDRDVDVSTKVEEKGQAAVEVKDTVKTTAAGPTVTGVDVKKSTTGETPTLEIKAPSSDTKQPKVGQVPATPVEVDKSSDDSKDKGTAGSTGATGSTTTSGEKDKGTASTTPVLNTTNSTTPSSSEDKSKEAEKSKETEKPQVPTGFIPGLKIGPLPVPPTGDKGDDQKKKAEPTKEPPKREEPTKEPPKREEPTKEPPKKEEPTKEPPKREEPTKEPPKKDDPTKEPPKREEPTKEPRGFVPPSIKITPPTPKPGSGGQTD